MRTTQFGYHLTIDLYDCPYEKLDDMAFCYKILEDLTVLLEMKKLMPPFLIKAGSNEAEGGKDPGGITGYITIAESHISIHTFPKRGFVSMDIYSCKKFNYDKAVECIRKRLEPKDIEMHKIDRGTKYPTENIY